MAKRKYEKKDVLTISNPVVNREYHKLAEYIVKIGNEVYKMWLDDMYDREHEVIERRISFILKKTNMKAKVYRKRYNVYNSTYKYEVILDTNDILLQPKV